MNKTELINAIAAKSGLSKKNSEIALNAMVSSVEDALVAGEKVVLVGFGTFEVKQRAARKGRNPQTKEVIDIPASKAPVFKPGKGLKDKINNR
jgi:DNA-binding protein HU-beta